jgi:hypothetical protein
LRKIEHRLVAKEQTVIKRYKQKTQECKRISRYRKKRKKATFKYCPHCAQCPMYGNEL